MEEELDPELWVRLRSGWTPDPDVHWLIVGNAHTFRGRFSVYAPSLDQSRTVDLVDCVDVSPAARCWLDGFLAGQEASLLDYLGGSDELLEQASSADEDRWSAWNARFRRRGRPGPLDVLPDPDPLLSTLGDPSPWVFVGERYRIWDGQAWVIADPQPTTTDDNDGWAWPGSVCERRRHCDLTDYGPFTACDDCHTISPSAN